MHCHNCYWLKHDLGYYIKKDNIIMPTCITCSSLCYTKNESNKSNINNQNKVKTIKDLRDERIANGNATMIYFIKDKF